MSNRIKSLFALILVVCISACDSDGESPNLGLDGTWSAKDLTANIDVSITVGGTEITTTNSIVGSNMDYTVTFTDGDFTTEGSYTITNQLEVGGIEQTTTNMFSNVSGTGTYTNTATEITIIGAFFDLQVDGIPASGQAQTGQATNYEINAAGELVMTQNETITMTEFGATSTVVIQSSSTWTRQ